ncbi:sigma factor-like helix-turn-helix DNA-binding protein [Pseudoclavibacter sp. AY1H1]|uniref:sigma factor-like helix-turn-helix DNA-binding protein n=1 Tax=Pseudoclavibacter sp. AY1H1 TaxID=2080584 RepID=UPI0011AFFEDC|nr:sigma factor-like helix-turn-helix DNA-binding protein [Pseudoclavibacter sp. AY1H1]
MKIIEVVDESPLLWGALSIASERSGREFAVGRHSRSWMEFSAERALAADVVIVSAEFRDHVPILLKTRAVARLGTQVVVVANFPRSRLIHNLRQEGAAHVLAREASTITSLLDVLIDDTPASAWGSASSAASLLTDRELQIAALFASRASPTTQQIAELLGLSPATVRTHLKLARRRLQGLGFEVSSRSLLRATLLAEGYSVPEF